MKKITLLLTAVFVLSAASLYAQTAQTRLDNGKRMFDQENYDGAIQELNEAIRVDPNMAEAYAYRARAYVGDDNDRALSDANKAIQLNPRLAMGYFARGRAYSAKNDNDRAIADYTEAIRLDPNNAMAYTNRGIKYRDKGDTDRAIEDYNQAIRLNPNEAIIYSNRGGAYGYKRDYDRAVTDFETALRINPNYQAARDNLNNVKEYQAEARERKNASDDALADAILKELERRMWGAMMGGGGSSSGSSSAPAAIRSQYHVQGYYDLTINGKTQRYNINEFIRATSQGDARQQIESAIRNAYPTANNINITRVYQQ
jgi:tetratricopeptide (TPR) repeat protein